MRVSKSFLKERKSRKPKKKKQVTHRQETAWQAKRRRSLEKSRYMKNRTRRK